MDIAVFSDIHSNHSALQACFDYAVGKGITNFILLGDYVSDCPNPQKTMQLIYVMKQYFNCWMIRGNREDYFLNYRKNGLNNWHRGSASGSLLYTYQNLTDRDFNLFDSPCLAAISTTAKEMGSRKFFWFAIAFQNIMSYGIALMVYQLGGLLTGVVTFGPATVAAVLVLLVILYFLFRKDPSHRTVRSTAGKEASAV